jgi:hypothetical protein
MHPVIEKTITELKAALETGEQAIKKLPVHKD